jgi:acyl transferase domain-containing protein
VLRRPITPVRLSTNCRSNADCSLDHMRGIGKAYEASLDSVVAARSSTVPFYSSLTGDLEMEPGFLGASYWRKNLESPVLFYPAVISYLKASRSDSLFLEVGPQ